MRIMPERDVILEIDHPHLIIRLSEDFLRIDVKGSFKDKVEEALGSARVFFTFPHALPPIPETPATLEKQPLLCIQYTL